MKKTLFSCCLFLLLIGQSVWAADKAPFRYVWGTAHHILPETHSEESGYFSLAEGRNGKIYVGTAKYNANAFLVEFDPRTNAQRIVIDTNAVNNLSATGYASQSKIHTRNFVAPSGLIYVGSQEGYRTIKGDESVYPGGYAMVYDPNTGRARSLGMPMRGEGVIDVVTDEARGLLYVVTSWGDDKKAHWLLGDLKTGTYQQLGVLPTNYASINAERPESKFLLVRERFKTFSPDYFQPNR